MGDAARAHLSEPIGHSNLRSSFPIESTLTANASSPTADFADNAALDARSLNSREELILNSATALAGASAPHRAADRSSNAATSVGYRAMTTPYRESQLRRSLTQLAASIVPLFILWGLMWFSLRYSYAIALVLAVPTAGFLVRLFILQHDCGHGSLFKSKRANDGIGRLLSILTFTPYERWRKNHAVHHATSGDLDRRGCGDVHMLTVGEYRNLSSSHRFLYRLHRHPLILFGIGPFLYFVGWQRFTFYDPHMSKKERASVYWTNVSLLAAIVFLSWVVGFKEFLLIYLPTVAIAASAGAWLFYVQHHFESTYWRRNERWNYFEAGLAGSSHYDLPAVFRWFTADIGLHHVHHLDSQIPNYRLQECLDANPELQQVARLTLWSSLSCASLRLWDEEKSEMVPISKVA
jgi:omega-6 fatty acid desaturase (delta-12 desaturase)